MPSGAAMAPAKKSLIILFLTLTVKSIYYVHRFVVGPGLVSGLAGRLEVPVDNTREALSRATPSLDRIPSSTAARVALSASSYLSFFSPTPRCSPDLDNSHPIAELSQSFL